MTVNRRRFLAGLASLFGAASMPELQSRVLDAGKPILLQPTAVANRIFVAETGHLFLGDHDIETFDRPSWKQYFTDRGCVTPAQFMRQAEEWYVDDVDAPIGDEYWPRIYDSRYEPAAATYHLLRRHKIGTSLRLKGKTAGRIDFFAGSNRPGSSDLWVEAYDNLSVSLLQGDLVAHDLPIRLVMEADGVVKVDGYDAYSTPED